MKNLILGGAEVFQTSLAPRSEALPSNRLAYAEA